MTSSIEENSFKVLEALAKEPTNEVGEAWVYGTKLQESIGLSPADINYAVTILVESGLAKWQKYLGTSPFIFGFVKITPRGRYELQHAREVKRQAVEKGFQGIQIPVTPVGSPYGFSEEDWEYVAELKSRTAELRVVFGYQFVSENYETEQLKRNVEEMFQKAVDENNKIWGGLSARARDLVFKNLTTGYGEHLFNEIARDIISADIAVFETSDLNPNVLLEMGVALTWGIRVLPIKRKGCPKPPSDISGQTWADYENNAEHFIDPEHEKKLFRMVERAAKKKGRSQS